MRQVILTHAQWIAAGGWVPSIAQPDDAIVIAILRPDNTVESASWAPRDIDPAERMNPDIPAEDRR